MAARQTAPATAFKTIAVDDDEAVQAARLALTALTRRRDEAVSRTVPWGHPETKAERTSRELAADLGEEIAETERVCEAARQAARQAITDARKAGDEARARNVIEQAGTLIAEHAALREFRAQTAGLVGAPPPPDALPAVSLLAYQVEWLKRELAGPQPEVVAPVPAGRRRVKLLTGYDHRDGIFWQHHQPGDVVDLREKDAADAITRGFAEAV